MISERILTVLVGVLLFFMMGFICWYLADGWMPDKIYMRIHPPSTYTQSSYEDLQRKEAYFEQKYNDIMDILEK